MRQKGADFWKQLVVPEKPYSLFPNVLKMLFLKILPWNMIFSELF